MVVADRHSLEHAASLLAHRSFAILTGAGISTESGIPDYRGPETRRRARNPIQGRAFCGDAAVRARYWSRSFVGWPKIRDAVPNRGHHAVKQLEHLGRVTGVITQNVDGLHEAAGSSAVEALHGRLSEVVCLSCGQLTARSDLQDRIAALNPNFAVRDGVPIAPDGDADLSEEQATAFRVPACARCGGVLKPHVVFFGEGVPRDRVERAFAVVDAAEALLVIGSSLTVFSGFRFPRHVARNGKPVAIINLGPTRADALASVRIDASASWALDALVTRLSR